MGEGKLVRDRIPEIIRERGGSPVVREAAAAEYRSLLHKKLLEEAHEVLAADDGSAPEELADVLEVVAALAEDLGIDLKHVHELVGWPGGTSPPGSHRSRRESLDSPGSCRPVHQTAGTVLTKTQCAKNLGRRFTAWFHATWAFFRLRSRLYLSRDHRIR